MIQDGDAQFLSAAEAAQRLGVTPRRVAALVRDGRLSAQRIGGQLLVDREDVEARAIGAPMVGRPFSSRRAWALIMLAAGSAPGGIDPSTLSKLRRQLRDHDLWSMRSKLVRRGDRLQLRAHSSDLVRLELEPGAIRTGARCAAEAGLGLLAPDAPVELYVDRATADRLVRKYRLIASRQPNLVLRIVTDEVRAWIRGSLAPRTAIALDLAEDLDARAQDVAREALSGS